MCAEAGADELGVIVAPKSKRRVSLDEARAIRAAMPPEIALIGVFQDATLESLQAALGAVELAAIQLHGALPEGLDSQRIPIHRALQITNENDLIIEPNGSPFRFARLLLDGPQGGSGRSFAWDRLPEFRARFSGPVHLAGGLTPDNVAEAIALARPDGVDVASGIEGRDGFKDRARVLAFVEQARLGFAREAESPKPKVQSP